MAIEIDIILEEKSAKTINNIMSTNTASDKTLFKYLSRYSINKSMIKIQGVSKQFKEGISHRKVQALEGLTLEINKGEVFGFLGPNGAGKSTAIKILINLISPDIGNASIMGKDVRDKDTRRHVGYLPENPYFYDYLNAEELLWFGGKASMLSSSVIKERTNELLNKVNLQAAGKRQLRTYSKGMVQRAGIALALIHNPDVVILDEPMSGLDPCNRPGQTTWIAL